MKTTRREDSVNTPVESHDSYVSFGCMMHPGLFSIVALVIVAAPAAAQLRPLEPVDFHAFHGSAVRVQFGIAAYADQHASLAGTRGTLREIGDVRVTIRTGRMIMEMAGTLQRLFQDKEVIAEPYGDARTPPPDGKRHDAGDYRVSSVLRLTSMQSRTLATLRFGTRLPTTDNRVGLDRDMTDFFATLGAHRSFGALSLAAEAGLSINGTRKPTYEQSDVLVYALSAELRSERVTPTIVVLGQQDFQEFAVRGNEDLAEVRAGVRIGERRWLKASWVRGLANSSPSNGAQLSVGAALGGTPR